MLGCSLSHSYVWTSMSVSLIFSSSVFNIQSTTSRGRISARERASVCAGLHVTSEPVSVCCSSHRLHGQKLLVSSGRGSFPFHFLICSLLPYPSCMVDILPHPSFLGDMGDHSKSKCWMFILSTSFSCLKFEYRLCKISFWLHRFANNNDI